MYINADGNGGLDGRDASGGYKSQLRRFPPTPPGSLPRMGINCGGIYVKVREGITSEAVAEAVRDYWTGRGAKPCDAPKDSFETLSVWSTGRLALGVFPALGGWVGVYDSDRYTCDYGLAVHLPEPLKTAVVGYLAVEVSDQARAFALRPCAPEVPSAEDDYLHVIGWV